MKRPKVALLGDLNIDTVLTIPRFPQPGWDGLAESATVQIGGTVVNTAVVLCALGVDCSLLGGVGNDLWAGYLRQNLQSVGVDLGGVATINGVMTGLTFITVTPDGERTMFSYRGANVAYAPHHLDSSTFKAVDLLHLSGYALLSSPQREAALAALAKAEVLRVPICLDSGLQPIMEAPQVFEQVLPKITVGIMGLAEAAHLSGHQHPERVLAWMLDLGMEWAVLKMGAEGCWLAERSQTMRLPAFPAKVVDTTGAGDSFTAGIIWGYLWQCGLAPTAILANALGALATQVYGAGLALPGRATLRGYLQELVNRPDTEPWREGFITLLDRLEKIDHVLTPLRQER
ncbi:carbohydrate kinase family protein [Thermanaerothrix sp.]|uniref:carbohydrate kinase family protein n=1 Tax=Thermanaerothrix sp. TaxID=2972675 RepID=UPI002ADD9F83|nr:carbohydrate kinase family protein [Thermanaerothrix sp.]